MYNLGGVFLKAQKVYDLLNELSVEFEILEHKPAFTVQQMDEVLPDTNAQVCKNLFLRDQKGKQHYLVVMPKDKTFNLKKFEESQGFKKMSFGSEKRLLKYLQVPSGSVSPFGLINDEENHVILYLDNDLKKCDFIGVHPNVNNITITFNLEGFNIYLDYLKNPIKWVNL